MNMELSRTQYRSLLDALDGDVEKTDKIADLFEGWANQPNIVASNF